MPFGDNRVGNSGQITGLTPPTSNNTNSSTAVMLQRGGLSKQTVTSSVNKVKLLSENALIQEDISKLSTQVKGRKWEGFKNAMSNVGTFICHPFTPRSDYKDWTPNSDTIQAIKTNNTSIKLNLASNRTRIRINNNNLRNINSNSKLKNNDGNLVQINISDDFKLTINNELNRISYQSSSRIMDSRHSDTFRDFCVSEFAQENFDFLKIVNMGFNEALSEKPDLSTLMGLVNEFVNFDSKREINISYEVRKDIIDNLETFKNEPTNQNAENFIRSMLDARIEIGNIANNLTIRLGERNPTIKSFLRN